MNNWKSSKHEVMVLDLQMYVLGCTIFNHLVDPITGVNWCNSEVMNKYEIPDNGNNGTLWCFMQFPFMLSLYPKKNVDH